jgi:hypothetical protein
MLRALVVGLKSVFPICDGFVAARVRADLLQPQQCLQLDGEFVCVCARDRFEGVMRCEDSSSHRCAYERVLFSLFP